MRLPRTSTLLLLLASLALCYGGEATGSVSDIDTVTVVADGDAVAWTASGCSNDWQCLDDGISFGGSVTDDATSYVYTVAVNQQGWSQIGFFWNHIELFQLDSVQLIYRIRYTKTSGSCSIEIGLDTNGTDIQLDTFVVPGDNSWAWYTSTTFSNTDWFSKEWGRSPNIEAGYKTISSPGFLNPIQISTIGMIVYHTRPEGAFMLSDSLSLGKAGITGTFHNDYWIDASTSNVGLGILSGVIKYRALIWTDSADVQDTLGSNVVDSAFLYVGIRDSVGTPGAFSAYIVTRDNDGVGVYAAHANTANYCNSQWWNRKYWFVSSANCTDTVNYDWNTDGLSSGSDYFATALISQAGTTHGQLKWDVTAWVDSIATGAGASNGLFLKLDSEPGSGDHYYKIFGPFVKSAASGVASSTTWANYNKCMWLEVYGSAAATNGGKRKKQLLQEAIHEAPDLIDMRPVLAGDASSR